MKKKITIAAAVLIVGFILLTILMEFNGYSWKFTPTVSSEVDGVTYKSAVVCVGYEKIVINDIRSIEYEYFGSNAGQ